MKTILLVEDNPDDALLTQEALGSSGIANKIVHVEDGVEALDYLFGRDKFADRDVNDTPALILLDLNMPRLGGLDVLKAIRAEDRLKHIPVVILTTSGEEDDKFESYNLGSNSYVRKPVDFNEFTEAARMLGMYWMLLNEIPDKM